MNNSEYNKIIIDLSRIIVESNCRLINVCELVIKECKDMSLELKQVLKLCAINEAEFINNEIINVYKQQNEQKVKSSKKSKKNNV